MIEAINQNVGAVGLNNVASLTNSLTENNSTPVTSGASFEQILTQLSDAMSTNLSSAEQTSMQHIADKTVGMTEVINSVMAAERSLSTAIAIRDKMVQAYTEISRMQI